MISILLVVLIGVLGCCSSHNINGHLNAPDGAATDLPEIQSQGMQDGAAPPTHRHHLILDVKLLMQQTQRMLLVRRLERALTLSIALALVFAGLCIYVYLVEVYETHWVSQIFPSWPGCTT